MGGEKGGKVRKGRVAAVFVIYLVACKHSLGSGNVFVLMALREAIRS